MSLDLEAIEAQAKDSVLTEPSVGEVIALLVAEVRQLRAEQRLDGKLIMSWAEKKSHLARRLQKLRAGVKSIAEGRCLDGDEDYRRAAQSEIDFDDAIAKRFRKKQAVRS